jgi:hypothetical protein
MSEETAGVPNAADPYAEFASGIASLLEEARRQAARSVNAILTATYGEIGRRIVEFEQQGAARAVYGEQLLPRLSRELTTKFDRGFGIVNLSQMRRLYLEWPIFQTPPEKSQTVSAKSDLAELAKQFPLSWSHYVHLLSVQAPEARRFYETEWATLETRSWPPNTAWLCPTRRSWKRKSRRRGGCWNPPPAKLTLPRSQRIPHPSKVAPYAVSR